MSENLKRLRMPCIYLLCVLVLSGCRESAPSAPEVARREAIQASSLTLATITKPAFLVTVSDEDVAALVGEAIAEAQVTSEAGEADAVPQTNSKSSFTVGDATVILGDQGISFDASVQGVLAEPKATVAGQVQGLVTVVVDGTNIVLTPKLESIILEEVRPKNFNLMRLPSAIRNLLYGSFLKGLNVGIATFIEQINAQIEPIREPIDDHIRPLGIPGEQAEKIKFKIGEREQEIVAPVLAATSVLIEPQGLHVMGQLLREDERLPEVDSEGTEEFSTFRDDYFAKATAAFGADLAPFDRTGLSLSEAFLKAYLSVLPGVTSEDRRREAVRASSTALAMMNAPTFLVTISESDIQALAGEAIKAATQDEDGPLQIGEPKITLGEQGISFSAVAKGKMRDSEIALSGHIDGSVVVAVEGTEIVLRPALESVALDRVEGVDLTNLPLQSPDSLLASLVVASNVILNSGIAQINAQIEPIREKIKISPLGTRGHPGEKIKFTVDDQKREIPAPVLAATSLLIEPRGLHVMGQLIKEGAELPQVASGATDDFAMFRDDYFAKATVAFGEDLAPFDQTRFNVSKAFLKDYLGLSSAVTSEDNRRQSILQNAAALSRIAGPDMVAFFPAALLKEQFDKRIEERRAKLNGSNISIGRADLSFGDQELRLAVPISAATDSAGSKISIQGVVEGAVTMMPLVNERFQATPSIARIEVSEISLREPSGPPVDLTDVNVAVNGLLGSTLEIVNGLIDTIPITMTNPAMDPILLGWQYLFRDSQDLEGQLDAGKMPDTWRDEFSKKGITLTPNTTQVAVRQPGLKWTFTDAGATYEIHKAKRGKGAVYNVYKWTPGLTLSRDTIMPAPLAWENAAILINQQGLMLLTDVSAEGLASREPKQLLEDLESEPTDIAYERYSAAFVDQWAGLGLPISNTVDVGLSTQRLAAYINQMWSSASDIQADYDFDTGSTPMESTKVSLYDKHDLTCQAPRTCTKRTCPTLGSCKPGACDRRTCDLDCGRDPGDCAWDCAEACFWTFKGKKVCAPIDPVCETTKAACNLEKETHLDCRARELGCNADADAAYAACQTKEEAGVVACKAKVEGCKLDADADYKACQVKAGMEFAGCAYANLWKSWAGDIGKISGAARGQGKVAMTVDQLAISDDLREVVLRPRMSGTAKIDGTLDFVPHDLLGHVLVCPWPGTAKFSASVEVEEQAPTVRASISLEQSGDAEGAGDHKSSVDLVINAEDVTMEAKITPSPAEAILQQNPKMALVCSPILTGVLGVGGATGDIIALTSAILGGSWGETKAGGFFTGYYTHKLKVPERRHTIGPIEVDMEGQKIELVPNLTDKALIFTAGDIP